MDLYIHCDGKPLVRVPSPPPGMTMEQCHRKTMRLLKDVGLKYLTLNYVPVHQSTLKNCVGKGEQVLFRRAFKKAKKHLQNNH